MPVLLTRTVRFAVGGGQTQARAATGANGHGGVPCMSGLGAHYELTVGCVGEPDAVTGYLVNIKLIDAAVRRAAIPAIAELFRTMPETEPAAALPGIAQAIAAELQPRVQTVRWALSPTYAVETTMSNPDRVVMRQRFEFAASHRLHTDSLSDEQNVAMFGKCNNPSGHGHNYFVEPAVEIDTGGPTFTLHQLEALTDELLIERFDHKHLNVDTAEFGPGGSNPSVEHIARVCFERLAPAVGACGATLREITVWETDRTSCTYPAR